MYQSRFGLRGFTLVEIMVVIGIISLLLGVVLVNASSARQSARDKVRVSDLEMIKVALRLYGENHGTYAVSGTGSNGGGQGWFAYQQGTAYPQSILVGLMNEGLLGGTLYDPRIGSASPYLSPRTQNNYMVYFTTGGATKGVCVFAQMERPTAAHTAAFNAAPISASLRSTLSDPNTYQMNYAACN